MTIDLSTFSKPALQFSGGKDSLACLYLLRPQLERLTVYWVNTNDTCPETLSVVDQVRPWIPNFVEIRSDSPAWRRLNGAPSDVVPAVNTFIGNACGMSKMRLSGRFDCCASNIMLPLHNRMLADGVDAVVRGTKLTDTGTLPAEGPSEFYHLILPLRDWSHQQVFSYLREVGAPENRVYDHFRSISAPECMGCTAWWDDGKAEYFRARHPERLPEYKITLSAIRDELRRQLRVLDNELEGGV